MPAIGYRSKLRETVVIVNEGGSHAPEDFPSQLVAEEVAKLLDEFGYKRGFPITPGNLKSGGGKPHHFGKMFVHASHSSSGIKCSANFEKESDRHFEFTLGLPRDLDSMKFLGDLKSKLEKKFGSTEEDEVDEGEDDPVEPLELIGVTEVKDALKESLKARQDKVEAQSMLDDAIRREVEANSVVEKARSLASSLPGLKEEQARLKERENELAFELDEVKSELGRVENQVANYEALEHFFNRQRDQA